MTPSLQPLLNSYQSRQPQWEKYAAVRSRPRRFLRDEDSPGDFFPPSRQPLLVHPKLQNIDEKTRHFILVQSLYKYMNDVANVEKDVITKVCAQITKNKYFIKFTDDMTHDALSIIIDEMYHAYVALDFMTQVRAYTGIEPVLLADHTELSNAIEVMGKRLDDFTRANFDFIAVCLAEHVLTTDLIAAAKSKEVCKTYYYVMHDHVLDEGRHAKYFSFMLELFWKALPEEQKIAIGALLPELLTRYFQSDLQRSFDQCILEALNIDEDTIKLILDETHPLVKISDRKESDVVIRQLLDLLRKTKVLDHEATRDIFSHHGLIQVEQTIS